MAPGGCRMWIPPEPKHPILLHHPTRKSVGYFGAVRLRDGQFVYQRELNKFDGPTFLRICTDAYGCRVRHPLAYERPGWVGDTANRWRCWTGIASGVGCVKLVGNPTTAAA
jgi:hypothetical protein